MTVLLDLMEPYEIIFTLGSTGARAWQNHKGVLVEVDVQHAMKLKQQGLVDKLDPLKPPPSNTAVTT